MGRLFSQGKKIFHGLLSGLDLTIVMYSSKLALDFEKQFQNSATSSKQAYDGVVIQPCKTATLDVFLSTWLVAEYFQRLPREGPSNPSIAYNV
jgi:hypothetical protein